MSYKVHFTSDFERHFKKLSKKYKSLRSDLSILVEQLRQESESGIPLGSNLFKLRLKISSKGKGKSGGARVITFLVRQGKEVYLVAIYDKSEIENLSKEELKNFLIAAGLI
ncbi:MAG: type II toxin-antitoxin system RelE/ParE family toxin [Cytophagales bacterium]|nr:type II toxin-antitoxin system RelE/ParE family toxin [Cytophagales bacterium]